MNDLTVDRTSDTLGVICNAKTGAVELTGESYPEDAFSFFESISDWVVSYLKTNPDSISLICTIGYLNSSSSKCMFDLFDVIEQSKPAECKASVVWRYDKDDEDNREVGEEFSEDTDLPFSLEVVV